MWVAPATIMLSTLLSYIDRQLLAVLSPMILQETDLSAQSYTTAISVFSFAYMAGNPIWGSVLDKVGLRVGMLAADRASTASYANVKAVLDQPSELLPSELRNANEVKWNAWRQREDKAIRARLQQGDLVRHRRL